MGEDKHSNKIFKITHTGEVLFWLIIILIIVSFSSSAIFFKEKNDENDYQIFLQDVDGLIVGSPVRMMGIEVGHVTKIKPIKDDVYVKFILTNPDVFVPQGTIATVEFSGMAGSKSLELYLPEKMVTLEDSNIIKVMPPKRLHDALSLLNDMFKKLGSIIYTTSSFGAKLEKTDMSSSLKLTPNSNMKDFIIYSDKFLDDSNQKAEDIRKSLEGFKKDVK